jgi:hypothetical protein
VVEHFPDGFLDGTVPSFPVCFASASLQIVAVDILHDNHEEGSGAPSKF